MSTNDGKGYRVLITDSDYGDTVSEIAADFPALELVCPEDSGEFKDVASDDFDAVVVDKETVDADLLEDLGGVNLVLKMGRSYYNVDARAVRQRGITFASVPRKGPNCVAELAMTGILALSKDLLISHESVTSGAYRFRGLRPERSAQWKMAFHWMHNTRVHEVRGKTLGIIGMGEIGTELARRANVMGMDILYYKRHPLSPELEDRSSAQYRELEALLQESDYVCLAVPHTPETDKMLGKDEFALMKEDAYLVNICRGGVVDEDALIDALESKNIAGAALDVFTFEPLPEESPLCELDNVLLTPHIGGGTGTSRALELREALEEVVRILSGEAPQIDLS
jgi:phosphoglycerate dehydrogenase-like enzyme